MTRRADRRGWPPAHVLADIERLLLVQRDEPLRRVHDAHRLGALVRACLAQLIQERRPDAADRFMHSAECLDSLDHMPFCVYPDERYGYLMQLPFVFPLAIGADFWSLPTSDQRLAAIAQTAQWVREQYAERVRIGDASHGKRERSPDNPSSFDDAPVDAFDLSTLDVRYEHCTDDGTLVYTVETLFRARVIVMPIDAPPSPPGR